jgi:hypothetical protein
VSVGCSSSISASAFRAFIAHRLADIGQEKNQQTLASLRNSITFAVPKQLRQLRRSLCTECELRENLFSQTLAGLKILTTFALPKRNKVANGAAA